MSEVVINSQQSLDAYIEHLKGQFDKHKYLRVDVKTGMQRTPTQNRSMHLYFQHTADSLNNAGHDFRVLVKDDIDVPWSAELVKDYLWVPVQIAITGHKSTTKPKTHQYSEIYEVLNRHISGKLGIFIPWPSKDSINKEAQR